MHATQRFRVYLGKIFVDILSITEEGNGLTLGGNHSYLVGNDLKPPFDRRCGDSRTDLLHWVREDEGIAGFP